MRLFGVIFIGIFLFTIFEGFVTTLFVVHVMPGWKAENFKAAMLPSLLGGLANGLVFTARMGNFLPFIPNYELFCVLLIVINICAIHLSTKLFDTFTVRSKLTLVIGSYLLAHLNIMFNMMWNM